MRDGGVARRGLEDPNNISKSMILDRPVLKSTASWLTLDAMYRRVAGIRGTLARRTNLAGIRDMTKASNNLTREETLLVLSKEVAESNT